jgi:hypothetical protein
VNRESKKPDQGCILTINGGSSSIKFALYQTGKPLKRSLHRKVDRIGLPDTNLAFTDPTGNRQDSRRVAAALGGLDTLVFSRRHRRKRAGSSRTHLRRTRLPRHRTE